MTKRLIRTSCASLLLLIQPQVLLAQVPATIAQDKPAIDEASRNGLSSQETTAQDRPITSEHTGANSGNLTAQHAVAQDYWEAVKSIPVGDEIILETRDGNSAKGRLRGVDNTGLTLSGKKQLESFDRPTIKKIYRKVTGGSRVKNTLIGTGVGTGVGLVAVATLIASTGSEGTVDILFVGMMIGAGVGAAIGAITGKGEKKVLIYEAR
jgi:hypothetical protein